MDYTTDGSEGSGTGSVFASGSIGQYWSQLVDRRKPRGKRYALWQVCILALLAKLSGEDHIYGIAQWAQERSAVLGPLLGLGQRMPCHNTYRRVLGEWVTTTEFEQQATAYLREQSQHSELIALDGKTLRGTIPSGANQGVHLLSAYLPDAGVVLQQVAVASKENEIVAAPQVLAELDLQGKIVVADAMHTQRALSTQILDAGGDYIWIVKGNHPQLLADIEQLFQPEAYRPGFSPVTKDFKTAQMDNKGHGRRERRTLTTSSLLTGYLDWPGCAQVFKLERYAYIPATTPFTVDSSRQETVYGITSLSAQQADAKRLNHLVRHYWQIENALHYPRDKTLREDTTRCTNRTLAQNLATLNNLVIALARRYQWRYLPQARRCFAANLQLAFHLVSHPPD